MASLKNPIEVFYIVGENRQTGQSAELAKFFTAPAATNHLDPFREGWHNPHVEERIEEAADQHPAHQPLRSTPPMR